MPGCPEFSQDKGPKVQEDCELRVFVTVCLKGLYLKETSGQAPSLASLMTAPTWRIHLYLSTP